MPICVNLLGPLDGNTADIDQKAALVVIARSPIDKLLAWKRERGWKGLRLYSDLTDACSRDDFGVLPDGSEVPWYNVFTRRTGLFAFVERSGHDAGGARNGLVSEAGILTDMIRRQR